jgi:hypothetical protein
VGSALFATFGGLRGALSLVMAQMVVASQQDLRKADRAVTAQARPLRPSLNHSPNYGRHFLVSPNASAPLERC